MDPLTALAAFNAACAVVKEASNNASGIANVFKGIGDMMKARDEVNKAVNADPEKSDLELYAAHAEMEAQWEEIKETLKWTGHWDKYLKFCADRREQEKQERLAKVREEQRRKQKNLDILLSITLGIGVLSGIGIVGYIFYYLSKQG